MKKLLLIFIGLLVALFGIARDFTYTYEDQTVTYTVIDEDAKTCQTKACTVNISGKVVIPSTATDGESNYTVTSIGKGTFSGCKNLTEVIIPSTVTYIGESAFYNCSGLTEITIPDAVTEIGENAFGSCIGLIKADFESIESLCKIKFSKWSNPLRYANHLYIKGEEITSIIIPTSITSLGGYTFAGCSYITEIEIPNTINEISYSTFYECSGLTNITIPNSVTTIGQAAFSCCTNLTDVTIPTSVTSIGFQAFYGCSSLTEITIPYSVKKVDDYAFYNCLALKKVICKALTPPSTPQQAFSNETLENATLIVEKNALNIYKDHSQWGRFAHITYELTSQSIEWDQQFTNITVGDKIILTATATSGLPIVYTSSDSNIAEITDENVLNFRAAGEVTITANQAGDDDYEVAESVSRIITVNDRIDEDLTLNTLNAKLKKNETLQLIITDYEWKSSDIEVATVSESGLVTAVGNGEAIITLSRKSDEATLATCLVRVIEISSITDLSVSNAIKIICNGNEVIIDGASSSSLASVYDLNGNLIYSGVERILTLPVGIYVIAIEHNKFKIILK